MNSTIDTNQDYLFFKDGEAPSSGGVKFALCLFMATSVLYGCPCENPH